jgi:hypothetical protein
MSAATEAPQIALARLDGLLNKVFAFGAFFLTIDVVQNAFRQIDYLNPFWFWLTLLMLLVSVAGLIVSAFFVGKSRYWYRALTLTVLFTLLTWGFQIRQGMTLPDDFKPWIWWALGFALISAVGAWNRNWVFISLLVGPLVWVLVATAPAGGGASLFYAIEDGLYTFFFCLGISLLVLELKNRAIQLDRENALVLESSLARVRLEAIRIERAHLNALLIDKSISALAIAAEAVTAKQKAQAIILAEEAISRLEGELARGATPPETFSAEAFLTPLVNAILNRIPDCKVKINGDLNMQLSYHLASGLHEATILAINNSLTHAPNATERRVNITAGTRGLKIVIRDNGRGFRMSNVHKTALGVRWVIFRRLESLGVSAKLDSAPATGTTWIYEWNA